MRAVNCLLAVLFLAAASSGVAQEKHLIDPMLPGSLDPKPLPPLKNPDAPSIPAKNCSRANRHRFPAVALDRRRFQRLPRRRRVAPDHWSDLASYGGRRHQI